MMELSSIQLPVHHLQVGYQRVSETDWFNPTSKLTPISEYVGFILDIISKNSNIKYTQ